MINCVIELNYKASIFKSLSLSLLSRACLYKELQLRLINPNIFLTFLTSLFLAVFLRVSKENRLLNTTQSGFTLNDSCINQCISIIHNILKAFDANPSRQVVWLQIHQNLKNARKMFSKKDALQTWSKMRENNNAEARSQETRFTTLLKSHHARIHPPQFAAHLQNTLLLEKQCQKKFLNYKKFLFAVVKKGLLTLKNK